MDYDISDPDLDFGLWLDNKEIQWKSFSVPLYLRFNCQKKNKWHFDGQFWGTELKLQSSESSRPRHVKSPNLCIMTFDLDLKVYGGGGWSYDYNVSLSPNLWIMTFLIRTPVIRIFTYFQNIGTFLNYSFTFGVQIKKGNYFE